MSIVAPENLSGAAVQALQRQVVPWAGIHVMVFAVDVPDESAPLQKADTADASLSSAVVEECTSGEHISAARRQLNQNPVYASFLQQWYSPVVSSIARTKDEKGLKDAFHKHAFTINVDPHLMVYDNEGGSYNDQKMREQSARWNEACANAITNTIAARTDPSKALYELDDKKRFAVNHIFVSGDSLDDLSSPVLADLLNDVLIIKAVKDFMTFEYTHIGARPGRHFFAEMIGFATPDDLENDFDEMFSASRWRAFRSWQSNAFASNGRMCGFYMVQQRPAAPLGSSANVADNSKATFCSIPSVLVIDSRKKWQSQLVFGKAFKYKMITTAEQVSSPTPILPNALYTSPFVRNISDTNFSRYHVDFSPGRVIVLGSGSFGVAFAVKWRGRHVLIGAADDAKTREAALERSVVNERARCHDDMFRWMIEQHIAAEKRFDLYVKNGARMCLDKNLSKWTTLPNSPNGTGIDRLQFAAAPSVNARSQEYVQYLRAKENQVLSAIKWQDIQNVVMNDAQADMNKSTEHSYQALVNVSIVVKSVSTPTVEDFEQAFAARQEAMLLRMLTDPLGQSLDKKQREYISISKVQPVSIKSINQEFEKLPDAQRDLNIVSFDLDSTIMYMVEGEFGTRSKRIIAFDLLSIYNLFGNDKEMNLVMNNRKPLAQARTRMTPCFGVLNDGNIIMSVVPKMDNGDAEHVLARYEKQRREFDAYLPVDLAQMFTLGIDASGNFQLPTMTPSLLSGLEDWKRQTTSSQPRPPSIHEAVGMMNDLIRQAGFLNAIGIQHRDIKPANGLVDVHMRFWLNDFGLSNLHGVPARNVAGTDPFMPIKQYEAYSGDKRVWYSSPNGSQDLYAIGRTIASIFAPDGPFGEDKTRVPHLVGCTVNKQMLTQNPIQELFAVPGHNPSFSILSCGTRFVNSDNMRVPISQAPVPFDDAMAVSRIMRRLGEALSSLATADLWAKALSLGQPELAASLYSPSLFTIAESITTLCLVALERSALKCWGEICVFKDNSYDI